jgi:hypothetical protein
MQWAERQDKSQPDGVPTNKTHMTDSLSAAPLARRLYVMRLTFITLESRSNIGLEVDWLLIASCAEPTWMLCRSCSWWHEKLQ